MINYSLRRVITAILILFVPILAVASPPVVESVGSYVKTNIIRNCETVEVPFQRVISDNPDIPSSSSYIQSKGQNGKKLVCNNGHGKVVSEESLQNKIDEVYINGTYTPPPQPVPEPVQIPSYTPPSGGGAICNDGTRSYSTGRGTCSWHGGVADWL